MSRFTDENGEQVYPTNVVIDHMTPEEQHKQRMEHLENGGCLAGSYNAETDTLTISSTEYKGKRTGKNIIIPIKGLKK